MDIWLCHSFDRKEFVDTYVNYIFNQSVEVVFEEFRKGFFKVCDMDVVEFFQPEELRGVMVGKENFDWETLKQVRSMFCYYMTEAQSQIYPKPIVYIWEH